MFSQKLNFSNLLTPDFFVFLYLILDKKLKKFQWIDQLHKFFKKAKFKIYVNKLIGFYNFIFKQNSKIFLQRKTNNKFLKTQQKGNYIVNSIIAFTKSLSAFFKAFMALLRETFACDITNSISFSSIPVASA